MSFTLDNLPARIVGPKDKEPDNDFYQIGLYMNNVATATVTAFPSVTARPIVSHACQVMGITPLAAETFQIELQAPAGTVLDYHAGNYLQLELDINGDGKRQSLSYSIANSFNPERPRRLQLFIQNVSAFTDKILKHLSELCDSSASTNVTLPMGRAFLQTDLDIKHVLIAAGSGISKIKCLTEEMLRQQPDADVQIYWSNKSIDDFYLLDQFNRWVDQNKNLNFTPILESANTAWSGQTGYIYEVVEKDFTDLSGVQVYLCGSPRMVYGTIDKLEVIGLREENCYSDVFEYAPRD